MSLIHELCRLRAASVTICRCLPNETYWKSLEVSSVISIKRARSSSKCSISSLYFDSFGEAPVTHRTIINTLFWYAIHGLYMAHLGTLIVLICNAYHMCSGPVAFTGMQIFSILETSSMLSKPKRNQILYFVFSTKYNPVDDCLKLQWHKCRCFLTHLSSASIGYLTAEYWWPFLPKQ